jgi:hypothetical protein
MSAGKGVAGRKAKGKSKNSETPSLPCATPWLKRYWIANPRWGFSVTQRTTEVHRVSVI